MKVLKAGNNIADCFFNEGWEQQSWVRLILVKGRWVYNKGNKSLIKPALNNLIKK